MAEIVTFDGKVTPASDAAEIQETRIAHLLASVGQRIRDARKRAGLSRRELSEKSSVSPRYIAQLETGDRLVLNAHTGELKHQVDTDQWQQRSVSAVESSPLDQGRNLFAALRSGVSNAEAGASILHYHAREPETGAASSRVALYAETIERTRAACDLLINPTRRNDDPFKKLADQCKRT